MRKQANILIFFFAILGFHQLRVANEKSDWETSTDILKRNRLRNLLSDQDTSGMNASQKARLQRPRSSEGRKSDLHRLLTEEASADSGVSSVNTSTNGSRRKSSCS